MDFTNAYRKIKKDKKFCNKVAKLATDFEARQMSTKDAWRWIKSTLHERE
jgi:tryptophan synthase beta subunit